MSFEQTIIQAIVDRKDREVIATLYKESLPPIRKTLSGMGASADDIDDVFQDAMIVLVRKIRDGSFDAIQSINSFLFIISRNLWYNKTRRDNRNAPLDELEYVTEWDSELEYQTKVSEREQTINDLFERLGDKCAHIFKAILFTDKKYKDIAEDLGLASDGVVKITKSRCKEKLVKLMQSQQALRQLFIDYDQRFAKYI